MLPDHASGASFQFISARKIERAQAGDLTLLGGSRTSAVALLAAVVNTPDRFGLCEYPTLTPRQFYS